MAKPQLENGYTKIANELLEAIYKTSLSDYEHRTFWFIVRRTYGYNKKKDWIAQKQIVEGTGMYKSHVSRTIKKLLAKKMIIREGKSIGIQKNYDLWKLPVQVTTKKLPVGVSEVTKIGNNKLPVEVPTKERKKIYKRKIVQNRQIVAIFDFWNTKDIINHRVMDQQLYNKILEKLKIYKSTEIKQAILNYSVVLFGEEYWYSKKKPLIDFLQWDFEKFKDKDIVHENYIKNK